MNERGQMAATRWPPWWLMVLCIVIVAVLFEVIPFL